MKKATVGQHMSVCDLADILKIISIEPMTARQVADQHKCHIAMLRRVLRWMVQYELAHVCGWDTTVRGTPAAMFAAGRGVNVQMPLKKTGVVSKAIWAQDIRIRPSVNMILFAELVNAIDEGGTISELTEKAGCNAATTHRFVNHMRRIGLAYVGAWSQAWTGYPARVFMLGSRRDVARPKPLTLREKSLRQYHARKAKEKQQAINAALFASQSLEAA